MAEKMIPETAIQELAEFSQAMGDGTLAKVAVIWALKNAALKISKCLPWVESLADISKVFQGAEVSKQINEVLDQRNLCALFLGTLTSKRTARSLNLSAIVDNIHAFRVHFAIVANTQSLLPPHKTVGQKKDVNQFQGKNLEVSHGKNPWRSHI
ncbi:MAG: hypothetical protein IPK68_19500 [Bdellovibrionales bacterium]|nr:hypothetical protein [Bdellovibrionales bacterium]